MKPKGYSAMSETPVETGTRRIVHLEGDIDLEHSPDIRHVLLNAVADSGMVLVDLSHVTYIDSSGIACLIEALHEAHKTGGELALVSVSAQAMRVLELARLDMVFAIHDTLTTAHSTVVRATEGA